MRKAIKIKHPTEGEITVCECCVNDYETIDDGVLIVGKNEPRMVNCALCNEEAHKVSYGPTEEAAEGPTQTEGGGC